MGKRMAVDIRSRYVSCGVEEAVPGPDQSAVLRSEGGLEIFSRTRVPCQRLNCQVGVCRAPSSLG